MKDFETSGLESKKEHSKCCGIVLEFFGLTGLM